MGRISAIKNMVREKRFGFKMDEVMSGNHEFEPGCGPCGRLPFEFTVAWGPEHIWPWANPGSDRFLTQPLAGTVTVGGLCDSAVFEGELQLRYFTDRKIRYRFEFLAHGVTYRFVGEKVNILPWNLPTSHTTCFGVVTEKETGKLISRSVTYFRLATAPSFLASLRLE